MKCSLGAENSRHWLKTEAFPRSVQKEIPIWIATGGNPDSTINAAKMGLPITYAIIGGEFSAFKNLIELYRKVGHEHSTYENLKVGSHSWAILPRVMKKPKRNSSFRPNIWSIAFQKKDSTGSHSPKPNT